MFMFICSIYHKKKQVVFIYLFIFKKTKKKRNLNDLIKFFENIKKIFLVHLRDNEILLKINDAINTNISTYIVIYLLLAAGGVFRGAKRRIYVFYNPV